MTGAENQPASSEILPYRDTKPVGAADFYFAINATFRYILTHFGEEGLIDYWTQIGAQYYAPVTANWKHDGMPGAAAYWRAFFAAEPGAEVEVEEGPDTVALRVSVCPAIKHLRTGEREIVPCFCRHCWYVGETMAKGAGMTLRVRGGAGSCTQTLYAADADIAPQDLRDIEVVR